MRPSLREVDVTRGAAPALRFLILGASRIDEELLSGLCLPADLQGSVSPCGETTISWESFQERLIGSVQEAHMTVVTTTRPATIADAVMKYAALVSQRCPEAVVYLRKGSDDPELVDVAVTAPRWDLSLLEDLQSLVFAEDVRTHGVLLNVAVYFGDVSIPDLSEFARAL